MGMLSASGRGKFENSLQLEEQDDVFGIRGCGASFFHRGWIGWIRRTQAGSPGSAVFPTWGDFQFFLTPPNTLDFQSGKLEKVGDAFFSEKRSRKPWRLPAEISGSKLLSADFSDDSIHQTLFKH
jgi:hypothetical protein